MLIANFWGHPQRSPEPLINQLIWAIDTDRNIKVDYVQMASASDNDVSGLDIKICQKVVRLFIGRARDSDVRR